MVAVVFIVPYGVQSAEAPVKAYHMETVCGVEGGFFLLRDTLRILHHALDKWIAVQLFGVNHFAAHNATLGEGFPDGSGVNIIEIVAFRLGVEVILADKLCNAPLHLRPCQFNGFRTSGTDDKEIVALLAAVLVSKPCSSFFFTSVLLHIPHYGVFALDISVPYTERIVYIVLRERSQQIVKPLIGSLKNLLMQVVAEFWNIRK